MAIRGSSVKIVSLSCFRTVERLVERLLKQVLALTRAWKATSMAAWYRPPFGV